MLGQSNSRFWTFAILLILSKSIPVSTDFASINCPFGIAPLPNGLAILWWLFSATVSQSLPGFMKGFTRALGKLMDGFSDGDDFPKKIIFSQKFFLHLSLTSEFLP